MGNSLKMIFCVSVIVAFLLTSPLAMHNSYATDPAPPPSALQKIQTLLSDVELLDLKEQFKPAVKKHLETAMKIIKDEHGENFEGACYKMDSFKAFLILVAHASEVPSEEVDPLLKCADEVKKALVC